MLAELRRAIVTGELQPGEQVLQDALAERFGVSRVPLREALKILEGEGQVVYRPHRGYFVAELDVDDLREVYRIRDLLESEAVRVAVREVTAEDLERLTDAAGRRRRTRRPTGDLVAHDRGQPPLPLHADRGAGMPRLSRLVRILWDATDAYRSLYYADAVQPRRRARRAPGGGRRRSAPAMPSGPSTCFAPTASARWTRSAPGPRGRFSGRRTRR